MIEQNEIELLRRHIGRSRTDTAIVDNRTIALLSVALDVAEPGTLLPPLWHYGLFPDLTPTSALSETGHPPGQLFPEPDGFKFMFIGSAMTFVSPVAIGRQITRRTEFASLEPRPGKSGQLLFAQLKISFSQDEVICMQEQQTVVYQEIAVSKQPSRPGPTHPAVSASTPAQVWTPTELELFRYSAATFDSHRIHYDTPFATKIEGYPGLVVHGPLIAIKLCAVVLGQTSRRLSRFEFSAERPSFVGQELTLTAAERDGHWDLKAVRRDGSVAVSATAAFDEPAA